MTLNADPVSTDDLKALAAAAKGVTTAAEDAEVDELKRAAAKLDAERGVVEAKQKLEDAKKPKKTTDPEDAN